jgi:hypothetical protein
MFMDPSGHFSLGELQIAQGVQSKLNGMSVPNIARLVGRIFTVHYGFSYSFPFGHSGIFVNTKLVNQGFLFHVIPLKAGGGVIERKPASLRAFNYGFKTINRKFTEFTQIEFLLWVASLKLIDPDDEGMSLTPVNYSQFGLGAIFGDATNCHKWALKAAVSAVVISRRVVLK